MRTGSVLLVTIGCIVVAMVSLMELFNSEPSNYMEYNTTKELK